MPTKYRHICCGTKRKCSLSNGTIASKRSRLLLDANNLDRNVGDEYIIGDRYMPSRISRDKFKPSGVSGKSPREPLKTLAAKKTPEKKPPTKEYKVEDIVATTVRKNKPIFLVKWQGWGEDWNTWEPLDHLQNCNRVFSAYLSKSLDDDKLETIRRNLSIRPSFIKDQMNKLLKQSQRFTEQPTKLRCQKELVVLFYTQNEKINADKAKTSYLWYMFHKKREAQMTKLAVWEQSINDRSTHAKITVENCVDWECAPIDFKYINDYLPFDDIVIPNDPPMGCECETCTGKSKCCGKADLDACRFPYKGQAGRINVPQGTPIYECNKKCRCDATCRNRVVQNGSKVPVCIFRTSNGCGWGLKASRKIHKGEFVCEYVGEVISFDEAEKRGETYDSVGRTYLFDLDFNSSENPYTVDAAVYGNVAHFINHSCDPNLGVWAVWINCLDPNLPKLAMFALAEIEKDQELTFDYMHSSNTDWKERVGKETVGDAPNDKRQRCKCDASVCRKYLF